MDMTAYFDKFMENVTLGVPQVPRMNSAANTVAQFLISSYGLPQDKVFIQGSYANGTAIEPVLGGEYDVDVVCVCVSPELTADQALDDLEQRLRADGRFASRVRRKNPCVRLDYAEDDIGKFHVDIVPVRATGRATPPFDAPRRGDGWHGTAPAEYTRWCTGQGEQYVRTVKAMKRWRDEQQTVRYAIKSIVLQVLVASYMPSAGADDVRISATFRAMRDALIGFEAPPAILNPVLPDENLALRWTKESFQSFKKELDEAVEWSSLAEGAGDVVEAADAWRELLGEDFPIQTPHQLGYTLGSLSHAETPADKGWMTELDPQYAVTVKAELQRGKRERRRRPMANDGGLVFAGHKLKFKAHIIAPKGVQVWWQVANTGAHAGRNSAMRGEIFRGKQLGGGASADETENWENTAYTGAHVVRALLIRGTTVVAESTWFRVNIYAARIPFRL